MAAHSTLTGADLHIIKGADTATINKVPVANGSGDTAFNYVNPRGTVTFTNLSTPYTLTAPTSYSKIAPTTTASSLGVEVTEATTARLTYTGTATIGVRVNIEMAVDQTSGANRDIEVQVYKNGSGVTGAQTVITASAGDKGQISFMFPVSLATNDYIEAYAKISGSGDVRVYSFFLSIIGFRS